MPRCGETYQTEIPTGQNTQWFGAASKSLSYCPCEAACRYQPNASAAIQIKCLRLDQAVFATSFQVAESLEYRPDRWGVRVSRRLERRLFIIGQMRSRRGRYGTIRSLTAILHKAIGSRTPARGPSMIRCATTLFIGSEPVEPLHKPLLTVLYRPD
jgi:hypothetical protein